MTTTQNVQDCAKRDLLDEQTALSHRAPFFSRPLLNEDFWARRIETHGPVESKSAGFHSHCTMGQAMEIDILEVNKSKKLLHAHFY